MGQAGSLDPGELLLSASGNSATSPAGAAVPTLQILAGTVNGTALRDSTQSLGGSGSAALPPFGAPTGLSLVDDTGLSDADRWTTDGRLVFSPVAGAVGYEYLISGHRRICRWPRPGSSSRPDWSRVRIPSG